MDELFDYHDDDKYDDRNAHFNSRDDSDDSFIVDDDRLSDDFEGPANNRDEFNDDDYDFLFGIPQDDKEKEEKKVKRRVKDLEKLLSSRAGAYEEFEGTEDEIRYTLEDLSYYYESRQALELELLSLFSGLIKREKISQTKNHIKNSKTDDVNHPENLFNDKDSSRIDEDNKNTFNKYNINKRKQNEKTMNKFLKNIIKQTFRGEQPEGRFGKFSKDRDKTASLNSMDSTYEGDENVLVTIDSEALANLRDINTLLHRERRGDYEELDGVALYKYPRCASIYIFSHNFVSSFILPLCSVLNRGSLSELIDVDQLVNELIYFFYQITQPPSENWYNYWISAQNIYKLINIQLVQSFSKDPHNAPNKSFKNDEEKNNNVKIELKYRTRVIDSYINGLNSIRNAMENTEIWSIIGEFRLKLEHFRQNGYISKEELSELTNLRELQDNLSTERDTLIKEVDDLEEDDEEGDSLTLNRLRKDKEVAQETKHNIMAKKKRIKQIRRELYDVTTTINEMNKKVDATKTKSEFHMQTVRILISQVLTIKSNMAILYIFNELGLLTVIRQELLMFFHTIKKSIVPVAYVTEPNPDQPFDPNSGLEKPTEQQVEERGDYEYYPSYLNQLERNNLWQYVRIVYNILAGINIATLVGDSKNSKADNDQPSESNASSANATSAPNVKSRQQLMEERERMERSYLIEMYRMNPKLYNKFNDKLFSFNIRNANYNQKNNYHYTFKFSHSSGANNDVSKEDKDKESLQNELNLLIGINNNLEHISFSNNTGKDGDTNEDKKEIDYELVLMLLVCCYDINREVDEEYYEPYDRIVLFSIKSFVIRYYSMVYVRYNRKNAPKGLPISFLFLAIKRYIGEDNIFTKLLLAYLNQLVKKLNYQNNQIIIQLIQNTFVELSFIQSFHTTSSLKNKDSSPNNGSGSSENAFGDDSNNASRQNGGESRGDTQHLLMEEEYINNICKEFFIEYIKNNIRLMMFNILKNFKMSYNRMLFISSLRLVLLLEQLMIKMGSIEFVPITGYSSNERLLGKDLDDELWDDEEEEEDVWDSKGKKKKVRVDERNIFNCKNNNFVRNDILRNGRIVHNSMLLLVSKNKRGKDVLLTFLDKVPKALLYDFKYFLLINSYLNTSVPTVNSSSGLNLGTKFGVKKEQSDSCKSENALFLEIVESFMDKWLLEDNKVLLLELFFNKNVSTISATTSRVNYNINSKYYIDPIETNDYMSCPIVQGVLDQEQDDIVDIMTNLTISKEEQKVEKRTKIDDELLLQYYNRFKYMNEGVVKYLSDLLNIPAKQLQRHLDQLLDNYNIVRDSTDKVKTQQKQQPIKSSKDDKEALNKALGGFYAEYSNDTIDVLREMYDNLLEGVEMFKLSGTEVEVIEPIQLTDELKQSKNYHQILTCFNIDKDKNILRGIDAIETKLMALNQFIESPFVLESKDEFEFEDPDVKDEADEAFDVYNVTSRDIIKLLIEITSLYDFVPQEEESELFKEDTGPSEQLEQKQPVEGTDNAEQPSIEVHEPAKPDGQMDVESHNQDIKKKHELILEEERKQINELIDLCFDVINNADKEGYTRYYSFSNAHLAELVPSDGSKADETSPTDDTQKKLGVSRELLIRKLLKFCNISVRDNMLKLVDNKINPEIVKNRLNIIKSLYKLSKHQLINILDRQQEQTVTHDSDIDEPEFEESYNHGDETEEHTYDYADLDFSKKKTPRDDSVNKQDDDQQDVTGFRKELTKMKKAPTKRTPKEAKKKKKLKKSQQGDMDDDDFEDQDTEKSHPEKPRSARQKRRLSKQQLQSAQNESDQLEESSEQEDDHNYRNLVGIKVSGVADDPVEREHIRQLTAFKRIPDIIIDIHNRSLELARQQKLTNSLDYNKLVQLTSAIS